MKINLESCSLDVDISRCGTMPGGREVEELDERMNERQY